MLVINKISLITILRKNTLSLLILISCLFVISGCFHQETDDDQNIRPVRAIKINSSPVVVQFNYSGTIQTRYETPLAFQVGGKISNRYVDAGNRVKPKQLLATLDTRDLILEFRSKESQAKAAETDLQLAKSEFVRYEKLYKAGHFSQILYQAKISQIQKLISLYDQTKDDLISAKQNLEYANLYSDYEGVITQTLASPGQVVTAGMAVMKMARNLDKEVVINIPEQRIDEIKNFDNIEVRLWAHPEKIFKAKIREIGADADPMTRTYTVKLTLLDQDPSIQLGMTANVILEKHNTNPVIMLPITSLFFQGKQPYVWVINPKTMRVTARPVTFGEYVKENVIINSGLKNGEWVVTAGTSTLINNQKIRLIHE